ncbi:MAG: FecR domain-containing protein [Candidatus Riflebacteria bacterium]|nr:FecR domain-containing protein [Candidatus Riflebacteria bacterium]
MLVRYRYILLLIGFLALNCVCFSSEKYYFHLLDGRAALLRDGGSTWLELSAEPIRVNFSEKIRTESTGKGEIRLPDGGVIRIKANSIVTFMQDSINLQVGEIWIDLKSQGRSFQVFTPLAVCRVLGTSFEVSVDRFGKTRTRVFRGMVAVRANQETRRQIVLQKGMMASVVDRKNVPSVPQKFDPMLEEMKAGEIWNTPGARAALTKRGLPQNIGISDKIGLPQKKGLPQMLPEITGPGFVPLNKNFGFQKYGAAKSGELSETDEDNDTGEPNVESRDSRDSRRDPDDEESTEAYFDDELPFEDVRTRMNFFNSKMRKRNVPVVARSSKSVASEKLSQGIPETYSIQKSSDTIKSIDETTMVECEISRTNAEIMRIENDMAALANTSSSSKIEKLQELRDSYSKLYDKHRKLILRRGGLRNN